MFEALYWKYQSKIIQAMIKDNKNFEEVTKKRKEICKGAAKLERLGYIIILIALLAILVALIMKIKILALTAPVVILLTTLGRYFAVKTRHHVLHLHYTAVYNTYGVKLEEDY